MHSITFIIGVAGSGKTTIAQLLSQKTGVPFFDADDFHPVSNIEKMKAGIPLTDEDRFSWLQHINQIAREQQQIKGAVIACSALKETYRQLLSNGLENVQWVLLKASYATIFKRLQQRSDHFFPASMLQSQFETLEEPTNALIADGEADSKTIVEQIMLTLTMQSSLGIIGLGVMGKSLALNCANNGISLSLYNRFVAGKEENIAAQFAEAHPQLKSAKTFESIAAFANSLSSPKKILLMVNAGKAIDDVINELKPFLTAGDIMIDGGNSFYKDTAERAEKLAEDGVYFMGSGISGGEEGALKGPSIMPGGNKDAYEQIKPLLEKIAAKDQKGNPCCTYISDAGSGHFVKMVHNGIEYAEMQLISEVYDLLRNGLHYPPDAIATLFEQWNKTEAGSYLLEITVDILRTKEGDGWLLDQIVDAASGKGTGSWAVTAAAELGVPCGMITAALFARAVSAQQKERTKARELFAEEIVLSSQLTVDTILHAYQLARIINHQQGFQLIKAAAEKHNWHIQLNEVARIWTNGCIIRSVFMEELVNVLLTTEDILFHSSIVHYVKQQKGSLITVTSTAMQSNIAVPALTEALNYLNAVARKESAANLIQAQRDYFGAHTYQRKDNKEGKAFHTDWKKK